MIELRPASTAETAHWQAQWEARHRAWCAAQDLAEEDVAGHFAWIADWRARASESPVLALVALGEVVGFAALSVYDDPTRRRATIDDLYVLPAHRRSGFAIAALTAIEQWCRDQGAVRINTTVDPGDPAQDAVFRSYTVISQRMSLVLAEPPLPLPEGLTGRPMTEAEFDVWWDAEVAGYADSIASSGTLPPGEAKARAVAQVAELLPDGLHTKDHSLSILEADGAQVATIWIHHHRRVRASYIYSVAVEPAQRGKGYGRAVMWLAARRSLEAGDQVLALNVFGHNTVAINLYTSLGYRITDQSRLLEWVSPPS
ncbi:GNAT family N-acetyltransferase [Actinopolymorpha alba]|uniref:GNAT family N-acetyltransferase n=1 Tax=Actinopolymorpha alba TaxID=533267 RepID=UPI0003A07876|nr:GNAT family N-acetyltransferase [Actinopolymorpha alba]